VEDQKTLAILAHVLGIFTGFLGALIIYLVAREDQPFAKAHAKEALNFQITMALAAVISGILILVIIGILGIIAVSICTIVFSILAAMAASRDEEYRYPVSLRFIK
jgi:uncharacterized Tic20 family protein